MTPELIANAAKIRLAAFDVDGVLTDGGVIHGNTGEELKQFNIKDGLGIRLLQRDGIEVALITGRQSELVRRRAAELGIQHVVQGREDKLVALRELAAERGLSLDQCSYMGDDLPDLSAIVAVGVGACPADAVTEVMTRADWSSPRPGGRGAVRDFCEFLLRARGDWDAVVWEYRQ
jgi:3-deoxy-D-manno-octulosonate 8-phosphate phosphatase (KDO 8-P phosphatase)